MPHNEHQNLIGLIWAIANKLRGPYRPPQYRKVMLPLIVLRRLDLVLAPTKDKVLESLKAFKAKGLKDNALEKAFSRVAVGAGRTQPLYNTSKFTFEKLLGDPANIASNLVAYIHAFSPQGISNLQMG